MWQKVRLKEDLNRVFFFYTTVSLEPLQKYPECDKLVTIWGKILTEILRFRHQTYQYFTSVTNPFYESELKLF